MDPHISLITLGVADLDKAIGFYRDGLGFPMSKHSGGDVAFFELRGAWLGLYPLVELAKDAGAEPVRGDFPGITISQNFASKEEVDAFFGRALASGAVAQKIPESKEWGGYSGYFKDLDGYLWEIAWNPGFDLT